MHSLCSGENILIAASIEVLVVLLHSIARARRRKVLYSVLSIAHQIIPTCGKMKLQEQPRGVFNCCVRNWRLFPLRGSFLLCITTELSELGSQRYFLTSLWNSVELHPNRWDITFPCPVWRAQMRNAFTAGSDKACEDHIPHQASWNGAHVWKQQFESRPRTFLNCSLVRSCCSVSFFRKLLLR